ncbi:MAG: DUF1641 domain-containing protein [Betaproteobacteria bacterium]|jgi:uncharacterized protein YjgD (DUF1641 family)|nr:DUF1641 domain-containing protein [Betaproteobacteria bacterium]
MNAPTTEHAAMSEEIERFVAAARDSLSDEMVARLAGTATDAMDLVDRVNRTGLSNAIPALADMVNNGDLDRLAKLARVYGSAEDAVTDEMVGRVAETIAEGMSLLDRASRGGAGRLVEMLAHMEATGSLERIADVLPRLTERLGMLENLLAAFDSAAAETARAERASGGFGGLWGMMRDPDNQDALRYLINLGKAMRATGTRG